MVGLYDGREVTQFVADHNMWLINDAMKGYDVVVTFAGTSFDLPVLRQVFPRLYLPPVHIDLRWLLKRLGLTGVMWTASGLDWKLPSQRIVQRLMKAASNGAIFCLHEGRGSQAHAHVRPALEAVSQLIPLLMERGYHFETVSEILCPTISNNE